MRTQFLPVLLLALASPFANAASEEEKPVERNYLPARPGDLRNSWADVSEARNLLGFDPKVDLEDGLRRTADFLLDGKEP